MSDARICIAGIDYGRRRIGIAVSDGLGLTAQPLDQIEVNGGDDAAVRLAEVLMDKEVKRVVYGLPRNMDGSEGEMAQEVRDFAVNVNNISRIPFEFMDERLTTMQADAVMRTMKTPRKKKKKKRDTLAAQIMLQTYLDSKR